MYTESLRLLSGGKLEKWQRFLATAALKADTDTDQTVTVWDDGELLPAEAGRAIC